MVTYQCDKGHKFIHAAKLTSSLPASEETAKVAKEQELPLFDSVETYVCPFCLNLFVPISNLNFTEYAKPEADVESIKSVELNEADQWIAQGYQPRDYFAKTVTLIKLKPKPEQKDLGTIIREGIAEGKAVTQQTADDTMKQAEIFYAKIPEKAE